MNVQDNTVARFAALEVVRGYWTALAADGVVPLRTQIDPRGIAGALEHCFVVERKVTGAASIRIAGMGLADIAGVDLSGMPFLSLFDTPARERAARALDQVFDTAAIVEVWLEGVRGPGRPPLEARMLLLPLRAADGTVRMALGCLVSVGEIGKPPRRFAIARRVATPFGAPTVETAAEPVFAEPAVPFQHAAPHLRVVRAAS